MIYDFFIIVKYFPIRNHAPIINYRDDISGRKFYQVDVLRISFLYLPRRFLNNGENRNIYTITVPNIFYFVVIQ